MIIQWMENNNKKKKKNNRKRKMKKMKLVFKIKPKSLNSKKLLVIRLQ